MPPALCRLDRKLPVHFLCCNTEITVRRVPRLAKSERGFNCFFSKCFRDKFWLFRKSAMLGAPQKHSRWLLAWKGWSIQSLSHSITYANIKLPMSLLQQVCSWWLMHLLEVEQVFNGRGWGTYWRNTWGVKRYKIKELNMLTAPFG